MTKQLRLVDYKEEQDPSDIAAQMSEEERIEFIREHGTEAMKDCLSAVFMGNKYKPRREEYWNKQLHKGRKMVRELLRNGDDDS